MRVATNSYSAAMLNQFNTLVSQQDNLQSEVSSGLSVQAPANNPGAMETTLDDLAGQAAQTQYNTNITTLQTRATSVYNAMDSLQKLTSNIESIATAASSGTTSQATLTNDATTVQQAIQQALELANAQDSAGSYLFGGTASTSPPFTATTDASGNITGVTYSGNSSVNKVPVSATASVSIDVPGANTTGTGTPGLITDSQSGADLFNHLLALQTDLAAGNQTAVVADAAELQKDDSNLISQIATNGAVQTRLTNAATFATTQATGLATMIANASSTDLVQTMVQLNQAQTSYQAALQSSAKIMQLSLLNYLPT